MLQAAHIFAFPEHFKCVFKQISAISFQMDKSSRSDEILIDF